MFACLHVCLFVRSFICLAICCLFVHTHHSRKCAFVALLLESELRSTMVFRFHTASISWKIVTTAGKNPWKKKDIYVDEFIFHQPWISWNLIWLDFVRQPFGLRSPEVLGVHPEICPTQIWFQVTPSRDKFSAKVSFSVRLGFVCSLLRLHVCACLRHLWAYLGYLEAGYSSFIWGCI